MRCPICDGELERVTIRDLGGVTKDLEWQIHAGCCPEHGWFQTEIVSRPPREIFGVERPFGAVRRLIVDGEEVYAFQTVWGAMSASERTRDVAALDPAYWAVSSRSGVGARPGAGVAEGMGVPGHGDSDPA